MGLIYGIKYKEKIIYVGQTKRELKKRISQYKSNIKTGKKLYIINHLRKHFDESEFIVLHESSQGEDLNELEKYYIKLYDTVYPMGMNLTYGGDCPIICEESRKKMSLSRIGKEPWNKNKKGCMKAWNKGLKFGPQSEEVKNKKKRFKEDNHFYGKKHTEETIRKISEKKKGTIAHNRIEGKILKYDSDMNLICTYENISEAVKDGYDGSCISRSHKLKCKHKGFYFIRENYDVVNNSGKFEAETISS